MGDPRTTATPTLQTILLELISAQSSLNMPTPEMASSSDVAHAYEHLDEAVRQLVRLQEMKPSMELVPENPPEGQMNIDVDAIVRGFAIDPMHPVNEKPMQMLAEYVHERLVPRFLGEPNTPDSKRAFEGCVKAFINQMDVQGAWFR